MRCYVGVTRQAVKERWAQHVKFAYSKPGAHPFRSAIRKYGEAAFTVETLITTENETAALTFEKLAIQQHGAVSLGYNISDGGEYDWEAGVARLAELRKDPAFDLDYRAALSAGTKASAKSRAWFEGGLAVAAAAWRKENPKQVWYAAYRASRLAARAAGAPPHVRKDPRFGKGGRLWIPGKKVHLARKGFKRAERVARIWANRSADERKTVSDRISASVTALHARKTLEEKQSHLSQLAEARKSIDHTKRKARQKEALAAYWTPERRQAKREAMRALRAKQLEAAK
jgi:hypothetical protein